MDHEDPRAAAPEDVIWSSSAPTVVSVTPASGAPEPLGVARAVGFGTATLVATVGSAESDVPVEVVKPETMASNGAASVWAPQLHRGLIYLADIYNGLWVVRFDG